MNLKNNKLVLKGLTEIELENYFKEIGEPKFRAKQVFNWVYNHLITDFDEMNNLPKELRAKLKETSTLLSLDIHKIYKSTENNTTKIVFVTFDNKFIEAVIISDNDRNTLCISTQVGCPLDCKFCATGVMGYKRNLSSAEIIDQYLIAAKEFGKNNITNIVYMGMGEPLLNYDNTLKSLNILTNELNLGVSRNRITVSTAGIPSRIIDLANCGPRVKLALSLHSSFNNIRSKIMPINDKYPLEQVLEALKYYTTKVKSRITFEYTLLKGINDRNEDIKRIANICSNIPSKINIIPFNSIKHIEPTGISAELEPTSKEDMYLFADKLRNKNITVMIRETQGDDIAAACGQLAAKEIKNQELLNNLSN
ncbi:MAG: 23S rRNA (adenine(2503)-C(2))-methyltransferase RlmN [bacterium]